MENLMNWRSLWEATQLLSPFCGQVKQSIRDKSDDQKKDNLTTS